MNFVAVHLLDFLQASRISFWMICVNFHGEDLPASGGAYFSGVGVQVLYSWNTYGFLHPKSCLPYIA